MGEIIDGKAIGKRIREDVAAGVAELGDSPPRLVAVAVDHDESSVAYTRNQSRAAAKVGIDYRLDELPAETDEAGLASHLAALGADPSVDAIILQTPLPKGFDVAAARDLIPPEKDVEAVGAAATGRLVQKRYDAAPCTALAALRCLEDAVGEDLSGLDAAIVGRSDIVGKPLAMLLLHRNATVTLCHTRTRDTAAKTRAADVVIAAAGRPGLVTADMVREGAIVIDVGTNSVDDGEGGRKLVGDVDFATIEPLAKAITPVPGGVGPVTVATLLANTLALAKARRSRGK